MANMPNNLFSFTGGSNPDPSAQAGAQQYIQQGQSQINPGQAQVAASSPISSAGMANLAQAFAQAQQQPGLPAQQPSVGPSAPMANLPVAPGQYQSQGALENATGQLYPTPYAAQQSLPWLQRMASGLMNFGGSNGG